MSTQMEILIDQETISKRVAALGAQITSDYENSGRPLIVICVLKGAMIFMSDLVRVIDVPLQMEVIVASSYGSEQQSSGIVKLEYQSFEALAGADVIVVDDISDSGRTLKRIAHTLAAYEPNSVRSCVLLDKPSRREVECKAKYIGFEIPDAFVVGYGLDYAGQYRELPDIMVITELENE